MPDSDASLIPFVDRLLDDVVYGTGSQVVYVVPEISMKIQVLAVLLGEAKHQIYVLLRILEPVFVIRASSDDICS